MTGDFTSPVQRASDADRERTAQMLHAAMGDGRISITELEERLDLVYAAKTVDQLDPVVADLGTAGASTAPAVPGSWRSRIGARPVRRRMVAVLSGLERRGEWVLPAEQTVTAFLGGAELDLTRARFETGECTLRVVCVLGGVRILVPRGLTVRVDGIGVLAGFSGDHSHVGDLDSPVLTITGVSFLGGVEVKRAAE